MLGEGDELSGTLHLSCFGAAFGNGDGSPCVAMIWLVRLTDLPRSLLGFTVLLVLGDI